MILVTVEIREEEVRLVIEGLAHNKFPGPDDLTKRFYKTYKHILVTLLTGLYNESLSSGMLPKSRSRSALIFCQR